jgi:hypothetical protein
MTDPTAFVPANDLEQRLLDARAGTIASSAFLDTLLESPVFVLLDKDPGPSGSWDASTSLLVLNNAAGLPLVAMFTAPAHSVAWHKRFPRFEFGMLVEFRFLLQGIGDGVGIVLNPGLEVGAELKPDAIADLQLRAGLR